MTQHPAPQLKPEKYAYSFNAPRTEGAPYPPHSLQEAVYGRLHKAKQVPPELTVFLDKDLTGYAFATDEYLSAATVIAGVLYRKLEQVSPCGDATKLAQALCIALNTASEQFEYLEDTIQTKIVEGLDKEVRRG